MASANEKYTGLSPVYEASDVDLSFLISQLSSVSGEITDRTLEELLRDAECQTPSLSWCRPKEATISLKSSESSPNGNPNLFKNAIETLSEISTRVQEQLCLEDEAVTYRLATSCNSANSTKQSLKSASMVSKPDTSNSNPVPKRFTGQATINAAARLYGKRPVLCKRQKSVQPIFVASCKPVKVTVRAGSNKPEGIPFNGKDDNSRKQENDPKNAPSLWEENARLHSQIESTKAQLSSQGRALPQLDDNKIKKNELENSDEVVTKKLNQFEEKLSTIRETYQVQLEKFSLKIGELEKLHYKSVENAQVQTESPGNDETKETQVPNFHFDELVLDSNFVPWSNRVAPEEKISETSRKTEKTGVRTCRSCSGFGNGEQKRLLNTIRKLQTELDITKKINRRLEVQQKNFKTRTYGRNVIRRQVGTQTIGLGACSPQKYEPALLETSDDSLSSQHEDLKRKTEALEKEVVLLNEQKTMSLRLLQIKHEEEIEVLLEEKMQLSKKLDAVQSWNPW